MHDALLQVVTTLLPPFVSFEGRLLQNHDFRHGLRARLQSLHRCFLMVGCSLHVNTSTALLRLGSECRSNSERPKLGPVGIYPLAGSDEKPIDMGQPCERTLRAFAYPRRQSARERASLSDRRHPRLGVEGHTYRMYMSHINLRNLACKMAQSS